jgi:hypothetical protein
MSLALYMDEHVPSAIIRGLRDREVDVPTVQEDGLGETPDAVLLDRAYSLGRVMFSRDTEFLVEGVRRQRQDIRFTGIVYAAQRDVSIGRCISDLELMCNAMEPAGVEGRIVYLPL